MDCEELERFFAILCRVILSEAKDLAWRQILRSAQNDASRGAALQKTP